MSTIQRGTIALLLAACWAWGSTATSASANPFKSLAGTWRGGGTAKLESGQAEKLSCKGSYTNPGGDGLGLIINCANASVKIYLRAKLTNANGSVSGTWEETSFNLSGGVTGKASANRLNLLIDGGLTGTLGITVKESTHSVSLSTQGPGLKSVSISFSRG